VAFLPALSLIPLDQYPGGRLRALVSVGDSVREGMLVGAGAEGVSSNVHATVPGRVVRRAEWEDGEGRPREGLLIRMEGSFDRLGAEEEDLLPEFLPDLIGFKELVGALDECGIVEMEGSGRSLSEMVRGFRRSPGHRSLVVRCVFDDPWLAADRVLCAERLGAVVEGAFVLAGACGGVGRVVFAVSARERKIGAAMLDEAAGYGIPSSLVLTGGRYPQRNRREMELVLRKYERRAGINLGKLLILGPATLAAAHDAVKYRRPVLERYVAVGGSAVRTPRVMRVRVGKRIGELFEECGGFVGEPGRVVTGSPFFGEKVRYLDEPVTKTSYAVVAMLEAQVGRFRRRDCISCGECRRVCPVGLDPEEMYKAVTVHPGGADGEPVPEHPGFAECHGCGCCELVCPSRLPIPETVREKKPGYADV